MPSFSVPLEIADRIIDLYVDDMKALERKAHTPEYGERQHIPGPLRFPDLKNCALAGRLLLERSRKYLFTGIEIKTIEPDVYYLEPDIVPARGLYDLSADSFQGLQGLARALEGNPDLARHLDDVHVTWDAGSLYSAPFEALQTVLQFLRQRGGPHRIVFLPQCIGGGRVCRYTTSTSAHPDTLSLIGPQTREVECHLGDDISLLSLIPCQQVTSWVFGYCFGSSTEHQSAPTLIAHAQTRTRITSLRVNFSDKLFATMFTSRIQDTNTPVMDFSALHTLEISPDYFPDLVVGYHPQKIVASARAALQVFHMIVPHMNPRKLLLIWRINRDTKFTYTCKFDFSRSTGLRDVRLAAISTVSQRQPIGQQLSELLATLDTIPPNNNIERLEVYIFLRFTKDVDSCKTLLTENWAALDGTLCAIFSSQCPQLKRRDCIVFIVIDTFVWPYDDDVKAVIKSECRAFIEEIPSRFDRLRSCKAVNFNLDSRRYDLGGEPDEEIPV
ncbi:hypothetical protein CVT24_005585 [Panaeolus cyanescens]|uniref:Uncharacterized protein n=1 Tax=Panaeolus cyanescens TaxID=181874 RepID=A0A409VQR3_9AGAR|nr:hypothetical protein CVT24_005585 [Panaeolus cyanescens]